MITRREAIAAAAAAGLLPAAAARAEGAAPVPPTLDELLAEPELVDAALSPDGRQLAILKTEKPEPAAQPDKGAKGAKAKKDEDPRPAHILLVDVDDLGKPPHKVVVGPVEVDQVEWANEERLLVWVTFWKDPKGRPHGLQFGSFFLPIPIRRVISIGLGGKDPVVLFGEEKRLLRNGFDMSRVVDFMHHDPRSILMQVWDDRRTAYALHRVDVYTGASTPVEYGVPATDLWLTHDGVPMLRMDSNRRGTVAMVYARAPGEKDWKLVRRARLNELKKIPEFDIVGGTADPGVFLVLTRLEGEDTRTIRTFDLRTLDFGDLVAQEAGHDMESAFVDDRGQLVATAYYGDRLEYRFADKALPAHHRAVNAFFANERNVAIYDADASHTRLLFRVKGPRDPGSFHLYRRDKTHLEEVGLSYPALTPERLAPMEALKVKTRDGLEITANLSTPITPAKGPRPLVVMPHGGPELRDTLDFDIFAQALAARGWLVLQPNFRGSGGYGQAFANLGRRHFADSMQTDVEDAVAMLVQTGRADPGRIAICGASYGGYAALMGAVRTPDLYRCAVSIAGVSDLPEMIDYVRKEDGSDSPSYAYWVGWMGDPKADRAAMVAASPARRAGEIKVPVLLLHGDDDGVVPAKQSKIMADALKAAGRTYEHTELKGVGHRGWSTDTTKTILSAATDFIAKAFA